MVSSLYISSYYEWLNSKFATEGILFDNTLFYVPDDSPASMMDYLVRKEIIKKNKSPGTAVSYVGFNRGVINKVPSLRPNLSVRFDTSADKGKARKFVMSQFELSTHIVTNIPEIAEDIEEVYNVIVFPVFEIPINMSIIFEQDHPDFKINVKHGNIRACSHIDHVGNMWGLSFSQTIIAPIYSLTQEEKVKVTKISVVIYNNNVASKEILFTKNDNPPPPNTYELRDPE